ncbi:MAG: aldo/keto reductase [Candidatus Woesearchaeota archaeon]
MIKKIALGTVQFGLDYGINNKNGIVPKEEVFRILDYCSSIGLNTLDTAYCYGISEEIIGQYIKNTNASFNIISKFPNQNDIEIILNETLNKLNLNKLYSYLSHDFQFIKDNINNWNKVINLKYESKVDKIGFSLYYTEELDFLLKNKIQFDIVQVPFNVLDRRFEKYFKLLKENNIEIHTRSTFLQGLFFKNDNSISKHFFKIIDKINNIRKVSIDLEISLSKLLLIFCLSYNEIDKIIVGIDNLDHLKDNLLDINFLNDYKDYVYSKLEVFREDDLDILIPSRWKIN